MLSIYLIFFMLFLPLAVISMIIIAVVNKDKDKAIEKFRDGTKIVFAYIFVVSSLFAIVIGSVAAVNSILDYVMPSTVVSIENSEKQEVSIYKEYDGYDEKNTDMLPGLKIQNEKNTAMVEFVTSITTVIVAVVIFIYFNKIIKNNKKKNK